MVRTLFPYVVFLLLLLVGVKISVFTHSEEVNIFSSRHYDTDLELYERFEQRTGISVNLIEGSSDVLIETILAQGRNSPADILITVDAGRLWRAEQAGLFREVESTILESRIPVHLRHPRGKWFGFSKRARVIIYAHNRGAPTGLSTYEDLASSTYRGLVCMRSSSNIYQLSLMSSLLYAYDDVWAEEWARGVVRNFVRPPSGNDTSHIRAIAAGICDISMVNTYYLARLRTSSNPEEVRLAQSIGIIFPNQECGGCIGRGTHINISGAGILKYAKNPQGALAFLEYLTSVEAQRMFAEGNHEYPVVEGVPVSAALSALGQFKEERIDMNILGQNQATAIKIYDRAGWR